MQQLFSRDNHNHDQVLNEQTFNLPLLLPENQAKPKFQYVNSQTGVVEEAPYSTDNIMHVSWVPYRLGTNLNTPSGSDSNIYFDKVQPAGQYSAWKDWLDTHAHTRARTTPQSLHSIDKKVAETCTASSQNHQVCTQTCVDWFTNRIVNPQGSMMSQSGMGGGCPHGTLRSLTCYPCNVHNQYVAP
jgi:hypothetical protein